MYLVWAGSQDTYTRYLGTYVPGLHPPPKIEQKACWWNCSKKTKYFEVKNNLNTELTEMGVFSAVAGNQLPNQLQKRVLPALFHLITPTFSPWTHTSNDSYIYQLSLVLATATVSFLAPYARTTRCEGAFFSLENQGKNGSLRSRASL